MAGEGFTYNEETKEFEKAIDVEGLTDGVVQETP